MDNLIERAEGWLAAQQFTGNTGEDYRLNRKLARRGGLWSVGARADATARRKGGG